jgi:hypothetical protein
MGLRSTTRSEFEYLFQRVSTVLIICFSLTSVLHFGRRHSPVSAPIGASDPTGYHRFNETVT